MALRLPRFYAILDSALRPGLGVTELARTLATAGVSLVQLRNKQATGGELWSQAQELLAALPSTTKLIVNDRADVAVLAGAAGVHLGQQDLPVAAARALLGAEKLVGLSTHSQQQVKAAAASACDYIAFGPVFATASKDRPEPVVGCEGLRKARKLTDKPLVAIGGITPENAAEVMGAGADSVAVISAWLAADDSPARLEAFRRALGRLD
ncbi:MAG: thiamine phosphate synthase [Terriglobia bacterium]